LPRALDAGACARARRRKVSLRVITTPRLHSVSIKRWLPAVTSNTRVAEIGSAPKSPITVDVLDGKDEALEMACNSKRTPQLMNTHLAAP
jgi:hypothetical protein